MKNKLISLILSAVFIVGCSEDNLDLKPGAVTEEVFYENTAAFDAAVFGAYAKLVWLYTNTVCCSGWGTTVNASQRLILMADDDLTNRDIDNVDVYLLNANEGRVRDAFQRVYETVFRANVVLSKLEEKKASVIAAGNMTEADARRIRGEALFLRAYSYYLAYNLWETAPIVNQRFTSFGEITTPNAAPKDLLDLVVKDCDEAEELLPVGPKGWNDNNRGRVTSGGAKILLGKALLLRAALGSQADYATAATKLAEIEPQGYQLMPDFGDNFRLLKENNEESLFELQFGASPAFSNGFLDPDFFEVVGTLAGNRSFFQIGGPTSGGGKGIPTRPLQAAFAAADPRRPWTLYQNGDPIGSKGTYNGAVSPTGAHVTKYLKENGFDVTGNHAGATDGVDYNNERVFRLSDALLMRAEALLESGAPTQDVIALLNRIRARARTTPVGGNPSSAVPADLGLTETNRGVIHQLIRDERRRELAFEGHRLFDLKRWHRAGKINLTTFTKEQWGALENVTWKPANIRFPFPQDELNINPGLKQNEGY